MYPCYGDVQTDSLQQVSNEANTDDNKIRDFYKKILDIIPNAKNIKDLLKVATVRYQMRDEINNAIIFSAQFFKKNKNLINRLLVLLSKNIKREKLENNIEHQYDNNVANLIILKSLQILSMDEKLGINFQAYRIFDQLGFFSKKINFLFNINELTYPEHLMISYDATDDLKYLKMLIKYLDISKGDLYKLSEYVSKIDFDNISDQERDNFRKFVFFKYVKNVIRSRIELFKSKRTELLKSVNDKIVENFENILQEN